MKIAVLGAGAMGCLYGAYLSQKYDVTLFDVHQAQVDAINHNGLKVAYLGQDSTFYPNALISGTSIGAVDLVIVFVKSIHTLDAVTANRGLIGASTLVMTLQNGAGNDRDIQKFVPAPNIIIGTSRHNSVNLGLASIHHTGKGVTTLGTLVKESSGAQVVGEMLESSDLEVNVVDDIQRIIWSKLFVNASINTLTALLETKIGYMIRNEYAWDFARRVVYEAVEVAEADGTYFDRREALETVRKVCEEVGDGYSSMYQDRQRKVLTEIDRINGAVVEQAKLYGVPTPYNALIVDLIHAIEGTYAETDD